MTKGFRIINSYILRIGFGSRSVVQNHAIRLVKVRFAQDLDSAVLPLAKQLSSGNNALHAVCGKGTIEDAAIAAATNRVFLIPRYVPSRHFSLQYLQCRDFGSP